MSKAMKQHRGFFLSTTPRTPESSKSPCTPIHEPTLIQLPAQSTYFLAESRELKPSNGIMPVQRQSHSAVLYDSPHGRKMLIFGGYK